MFTPTWKCVPSTLAERVLCGMTRYVRLNKCVPDVRWNFRIYRIVYNYRMVMLAMSWLNVLAVVRWVIKDVTLPWNVTHYPLSFSAADNDNNLSHDTILLNSICADNLNLNLAVSLQTWNLIKVLKCFLNNTNKKKCNNIDNQMQTVYHAYHVISIPLQP